jgi:hypothetical protein
MLLGRTEVGDIMQASGRTYAQYVPRSIMPKQQRVTFAKALRSTLWPAVVITTSRMGEAALGLEAQHWDNSAGKCSHHGKKNAKLAARGARGCSKSWMAVFQRRVNGRLAS